ncbi:TetR/AcrR family transcriptional regulator [Yeguia hominis]|uniref:TetR/AcrR family transcriptional regulator n=1 Tax=Yeguia hominis TaxID=2763662 RepID=A0A926D6X4_9FIRM|nr:TetR/AcrR family transcriptional regulator [Yeguia hominis]MBC8532786.1 TetR/AcrR family transcriptional regulator [Yeguia hominis]
MANRDHSLDDGIVQAAYSEFLTHGFQKASLHKIAEKAGVTTGAIYTRYKNKDTLFVSLLQDFFAVMDEAFSPAVEEYAQAKESGRAEDIICAIRTEEKVYFRLLTEHYDDCTLFFCRSDGSSVEEMLKELMNRKTNETVKFFSDVYAKVPNEDAIRLLMGSQFWYFRQLLNEHLDEKEMFACLRSILDFFNAGWRQLCDSLN